MRRRPFLWMAAILTMHTGGSMVGAAGRGCVADLIIVNARVHTVDPSMPSAQAVAVCGDRLGRVGSNEDVNG